MIQNIAVSKIHPHCDNPRKDLGDLTELAESIKSNGILQNLTVVPDHNSYDCDIEEFERYIAVIGHRRLAAAKLAGLTEVPCAISEMDYKTQVATMLTENMQRNDLTIWEQAQGFQMMLDLGESISDISQNTGFSETTVRRRVKLLEFDKEKFRQSVERGGTLMDYAELDKIHDVDLRNKVLDKIGTSNFNWELQNAIEKENKEKKQNLIIAELEKFATLIESIESEKGLRYVNSYYPSAKRPEITVPDDVDTVEYFFQISEYGAITLYKKSDNANSAQQGNSAQDNSVWKEQQERRAALDEISKQAYQLRCNFIKELTNSSAKKNISVIIEYLLRAIMSDECYSYFDFEDFTKFLAIEINEEDEENFDSITDHITAQPERHLLTAAYLLLDSAQDKYYDWNNQHDNNVRC